MAKKKRHLRVEIATKLAQANGLATQGKRDAAFRRSVFGSFIIDVANEHRTGQRYGLVVLIRPR